MHCFQSRAWEEQMCPFAVPPLPTLVSAKCTVWSAWHIELYWTSWKSDVFSLQTDSTVTITCADRKWNKQVSCEPVDCGLPDKYHVHPAHFDFPEGTTYGKKSTFQCKEPAQLVGEKRCKIFAAVKRLPGKTGPLGSWPCLINTCTRFLWASPVWRRINVSLQWQELNEE